MPTPIFTRLHKLYELIDPCDWPEESEHHYVMGQDLMLAMGRDDVQRAIKEMIDADMARLPFAEILVEFSVTPGVTRFLWLSETLHGFRAKTIMLTSSGLATVPTDAPIVTMLHGDFAVQHCDDARDAQAIALGTSFGLLMLHTRGIEKTRIDPAALNKARANAGKPEVPTHTVLRIGVVYDRQGKPVAAGKRGPCYLRPGNSRNQAYGPQWSLHRWIYVEPHLVNYRDGDALPATRARVVKMGKPNDK